MKLPRVLLGLMLAGCTPDSSSGGLLDPTSEAGSTAGGPSDLTTTAASTRGNETLDSLPGIDDGESGNGGADTGLDPPDTTTGAVDCDEAVLRGFASATWNEIPQSAHRQICACDNGYPEVCGASNCGGAFSYSGAAFDTLRNRLIMWGGGHNDYYGNEVYAFDVPSLTWSRLTEPSPPAPSSVCVETLADGLPSSRHTYDGLTYLPEIDSVFSVGGIVACEAADLSRVAWLFDLATNTWSRIEPEYEGFSDPIDQIYGYTTVNTGTAYDPVTGRVFVETNFSLSSYDALTNTWTLHIDLVAEAGGRWAERGVAIDPVARRLVSVGAGTVWVYDLETFEFEQWQTEGPSSVVDAAAPGMAYDPGYQRVVGWGNAELLSLDLDTRTWTQVGPAWTPNVVDQVHGRFDYVPCEDGYLAVAPDPDANVRLFKK